jgi:hypothetical protein
MQVASWPLCFKKKKREKKENLMTKHTMISASQKAFQNYIRLEMHAHLKHEFYEPHLSIVHLRHEAWYTLNPELKTIVIT